MKAITVFTPRPASILLSSHPARAVDLAHTDVAKTWADHEPVETDYQREIERAEYLDDR